MKRTSFLKGKKRTSYQDVDGNNDFNGKEFSSSQSHSSSTKKRISHSCILRIYFNDTVPEETVRSTLPYELAEEYLSFIQQCGRKKKKSDVSNKQRENSEKELPQSNDNNKSAVDHKENLPVSEKDAKSVHVGKLRKKEGRRRKNTVKNLLKCLLCSEEFPTKLKKQDHYQEHLGPRGYECTFCPKAFDNMPALVSHVSRIHLIDKKLACKICGKRFRREWLLRSHSLTHTSGRKFSCPVCKMGFTHKRHLFEHISGHVGFHPYKCEECGKRFQKSSYLSLHRKTHVSVRPFKCKLCNIQCSSYSAIEMHALMHTENLGFECADCNVRIPATMRSSHLISHSRKKNCLCNLCPARFHAKSTLKDHLKAHSCIKEYKCDVCKKVMKTVRQCSGHICPKWQGSVTVELCPRCKSYIKKDGMDGHKTLCGGKPSPTNSDVGYEANETELWDESGECVSADTNNCNEIAADNLNYDEDGCESSSLSESMSDESDVDDVSEFDECSKSYLILDSISERESLDLECGLVQQIKKVQNDVEEDDSDDDDDFQDCDL